MKINMIVAKNVFVGSWLQIWENMDGIVSILRACAMDQCAAIQLAACVHLCNFCDHHHQGLFYFTEALAR